MILISACLLGHKVKYNGDSNPHELLLKYNERGRFLAVCPECFAKLPVPRPPMEIQNGTGRKVISGRSRVKDAEGMDTTGYLLDGADKVLKIAEAYRVRVAILKEGSPSCGSHRIYDGSFSGRCLNGAGVTATVLEQAGLKVFSEEEMTIGRLEELIAEDIRREKQKQDNA